jgi:tripartite-type tricarboxylate transporter receptor subunit TctC
MTNRVTRRYALGLGVGAFAGLHLPVPRAAAQTPVRWPTRPLRLVVPYPPGGNVDLIGRLIGPPLASALGQPVVVDNKGGAGGAIGAADAARSEPDGHTVLIGDIATHAINPAVNATLPYRPQDDFSAVIRITSVPLVLAINPKLGPRTVAEFIAFAKAAPKPITYASAGIGTPQHLAFELLKARTGIAADHVPYRGSAPAVADVIAGHVDAIIDGTTIPHVQSGALQAVAVTGETRSAVLADVPTLAEGGVAGYAFASWHGLFVPRGVPAPIIARLNAEVATILADPAIRSRLANLNISVVGGSADAFAAFVAAEAVKIQTLARAADVKAN